MNPTDFGWIDFGVFGWIAMKFAIRIHVPSLLHNSLILMLNKSRGNCHCHLATLLSCVFTLLVWLGQDIMLINTQCQAAPEYSAVIAVTWSTMSIQNYIKAC